MSRIPDGKWWDQDVHPGPWQVGDYCLDADRARIWIQVPDGAGRGVPVHLPTQHAPADAGETRWDLTENEDGTLTLTPSINAIGKWHGWLTNGELVDA